jgi:hypothetical protein
MILRRVALVLMFAVAGCGDKAAAPVAVAGNDVAAEAVADVDAAMAEAQRGDRTLAAPAPAK